MPLFLHFLLAIATLATAQQPTEIYNGGFSGTLSKPVLRIGNGGAGQSGLIRALGNAYIQSLVASGQPPILVEWYKSDTTETIAYLQTGIVDLGITYTPSAESVAISQGIVRSPSHYLFRDHFLLVGPPSNPANLTNTTDIGVLFAQLHATAESATSTPLVRFLSRYDKSATNIAESQLWLAIGQAPWATAYSTWYHQYINFPAQALRAAALLEEYTLTDRGTLLSSPKEVQNATRIYRAGTNNATDPLLLPAHLLVGAKAANMTQADGFAKWAVSKTGGQKVVEGFEIGGQVLYSTAPEN